MWSGADGGETQTTVLLTQVLKSYSSPAKWVELDEIAEADDKSLVTLSWSLHFWLKPTLVEFDFESAPDSRVLQQW